MKLRSHLIILVVAALLPVLIFASVMIHMFSKQQYAAVDRGLLDTTRALTLAVDRDLEASIESLRTLATSGYLDSRDLKQFYDQAVRMLKSYRRWQAIVLFEPSGQQIMNTRRPFGSPLPPIGTTDVIKQVVQTAKPVVSNLFPGQLARGPIISVDVPVIREGKTKYVLAASASPEFLTSLLAQQKIPSDWLATILDRNKIIIARSRDLEHFLGKPAGPGFAAKSEETKEITWRGVTLDGVSVYAAASRSELSGWTVGLATPASAVEAPLRRSLWITAGGGLTLLLAGIIVAALFGKRIANSISSLSNAAAALGRSEMPQTLTSPVIEVNNVARVIENAAAKRKRLEREVAEISEKEQQRIGQDLHDGLGQQLTGIAFLAKGLEEKLSRKTLPESVDAGKIAHLVAQAVSHTRDLARGLSAVPVGGDGLMSALEELAASVSGLFNVSCQFRCDQPVLLQDNAVATHLYRIAQEAVDNAVKHGQPSQILISLAEAGGTITLSVFDDGRGLQGEPQNVEGMGLRTMRYRAEVIGAMLSIQPRPQGGVLVTCSISNLKET